MRLPLKHKRTRKGTKHSLIAPAPARRKFLPRLEALEDRLVPSQVLNIPFSTQGTGVANFTLTSITYNDGNALSIGGNAAAQEYLATGTTIPLGGGLFIVVGGTAPNFDTLFQSQVATLNDASVSPANSILGGNYTLVARITEHITSETINTVTGQVTASYSMVSAPQDYVQLYYNNPATANDGAGTGFNTGTLILSANPAASGPAGASQSTFTTNVGSSAQLDELNPNLYPGQLTATGNGGATINAAVTSVNSNFFVGQSPTTITFTVAQAVGQSTPFNQVQPSAAFLTSSVATAVGVTPTTDGAGLWNGVTNPSLGLVNGGPLPGSPTATSSYYGGPDFQFQTTGTESFYGPASPSITTSAGGTVVVGGGVAMTDSATLSGAVNIQSGDTITFTLTAPGGGTVYTTTVPVSANGTYTVNSTGSTDPGGYPPTAAGTYQWTATFSGDANNNPVSSAPGDEPENAVSASITITPNAVDPVNDAEQFTSR